MFKAFAHRIANSFSLWMAGISFGVIFFFLFGVFVLQKHFVITYALFNPFMVWIAVIVGGVVVALSFSRKSQTGDNVEKKNWVLLAFFVSIAYAFVLGIGSYLFAIIFSIAFRNLTYDFISAPFLLAAYGSLIAYFVSESVQHFDRRHFAYLIAIEFLAGFFLAAVKTGDNYWWRGSICSLGMPVNGHPLIFNFTLVLTGCLLIIFSLYLAPTIESLVLKGLMLKQWSTFLERFYFTLSSMLILVGLFPYGVNDWMNKFHIYVGDAIFVFFAIFLGFASLIFKKFPLRFKVASYFLLAVGLMFYPLHFQIGYLAYAVMELMMIVVIVVWFMIFVRTITVLTKET